MVSFFPGHSVYRPHSQSRVLTFLTPEILIQFLWNFATLSRVVCRCSNGWRTGSTSRSQGHWREKMCPIHCKAQWLSLLDCIMTNAANSQTESILPANHSHWYLNHSGATGFLPLRDDTLHQWRWNLAYMPNYLSGARCTDLYMVHLRPLPPNHLCFRKSRMVYHSGSGLPGLSWKKAVKWLVLVLSAHSEIKMSCNSDAEVLLQLLR